MGKEKRCSKLAMKNQKVHPCRELNLDPRTYRSLAVEKNNNKEFASGENRTEPQSLLPQGLMCADGLHPQAIAISRRLLVKDYIVVLSTLCFLLEICME